MSKVVDVNRLRDEIKDEIHNRDLRDVALILADTFEYMENCSSSRKNWGIFSYDKVWVEENLERALDRLRVATALT